MAPPWGAAALAYARPARRPPDARSAVAARPLGALFDYRGFGDSEDEPRQLLDISMQHADWKAALSFTRSLSGMSRFTLSEVPVFRVAPVRATP